MVNEMTHLINIYQDRNLCVIGDMIEDISSGDASLPIHPMFISSGLTQHVTSPTCDSGILIDYLYTLNIYLCDVKTEVDCYYSDHDIVTFAPHIHAFC